MLSLRARINLTAVVATMLPIHGVAAADELDLSAYRLVDLTHAYNEQTVYWPTLPSHFEKETLEEGYTEGGYYYSAYSVCTPEHGGTHLDAPVHFAEGVMATDALPLENLIAEVHVETGFGRVLHCQLFR